MAEFTAEDFTRLVTLSIPSEVEALAFSPDGTLLAVASGDKVHIYRVPRAKGSSGAGSPQGSTPAGG
jgi:hypothetical protein